MAPLTNIRWYIAGPMSGYPQFNYPLFERAAAYLRTLVKEVISPAEMDSEQMKKIAYASTDGDLAEMEKKSGETWADVLARDVKLIGDAIEGIVLLPKWFESNGARLETFVGLIQTQKRPFRFAAYHEMQGDQRVYPFVQEVPVAFVQDELRYYMPGKRVVL